VLSHPFLLACALLLATLILSPPLAAGDWPQILGPHRNGIAEGEKIAATIPAGGPKTLWQKSVGRGFAGVAVAAGKAIVFHRIGNQEVADCLDARSGEMVWKASFPTRYVSSISEDDGPRCVPLVNEDRVYLFGAGGGLHCVSLADGKKLWSHECASGFGAPDGYFGAGSSPIVEEDKLLVNVGAGRNQAGIVAFDGQTGNVVWKATDELASYSSSVAATIDGVRHVIFITRLSVVSLDPASGQVRFQFPFGARGPTVNAANPLVIDGHLFLTASYGIGAVYAKIGKTDARTLWKSDDALSSQYPTPIYHGGLLYGSDGRQDVGVARLRCVDPKDGSVRWTKENFGMAAPILADGKLLLMKADGKLVLAEPTPQAFKQLAAAEILKGTVRALPALANGLLYVRDETTLKCVDLRPE
jgi:outer membrane protein assembly factor BamB